MRQHAAVPVGRTRRWVRGWWPDRNALRRRSDRVETAVGAALLVLFLAGAPLVSLFGGRWAYETSVRAQQAQEASWRQAPAVLLASAPDASFTFAGSRALPEVRATWRAPNGAKRTGIVPAPASARTGSTVKIWVDGSGRLVGAPLQAKQVTGQAVLGAVLGPCVLGFAVVCAWALTRVALSRRRLAAWEEDWRITWRRWSSRR